MDSGPLVLPEVVIKETVYHRLFFVITFALITVLVVFIGVNWPKQYTSSTTIFVEEQNILGPLMEGAAIQTEVLDRAAIAREMIFGNRIMHKLLDLEALVEPDASPELKEHVIDSIKDKLIISNVRENLIKIEYKNRDPDKAFMITRTLAKLFIEESMAEKELQSTEAFEFIDKQAKEYEKKLQHAQAELKSFRSNNVDAQPGLADIISRRINELQQRKEQITQDLKEAYIRRESLQRQLSGEVKASNNFSRSEQFKSRIAELQSQLDVLRLSYHETYPDIVHIKDQIVELRQAVKESELENDVDQGPNAFDESVLSNPVYQQLQRDLYDTNTTIETLNARLEHAEKSYDEQYERARKISEFEVRLQELTREYEVNNERYTDLMRRREQARVSMNLDIERKGITLKIEEPANRPHNPSGLRFMHFLLAAPVAGVLVPVGMLYLWLFVNPRIRSRADISTLNEIHIIGETPHLLSSGEIKSDNIFLLLQSLLFLSVIVFLVVMAVLRIKGVL